jgi:hypothetical protein
VAVIEREKLYEQVWTVPGARLAALYGISDVGLAKVCKRYRIPRPGRGYWARIAAGQKVRKAPLPSMKGAGYDTVHLQGWDVSDEVLESQSSVIDAPTPGPDAEQPKALHQLVLTAKVQLEAATRDQNGLLRTDTQLAPAIHVSPAAVPRALAILQSLIAKWEARGGTVVVGVHDGTKTALAIGPDELVLELYEEIDETKPVSDSSRLTGRLAAVIDGTGTRRRWADRKTQRLEKVIGTLVTTAAQALEMRKAERLDEECVQRQKRRVNELRRAVVGKKDEDFGNRQKLMEHVKRWHDAERVRGYLKAVQAALDAEQIQPFNPDAFQQWFEWAKRYADSVDPIVQAQLPEEAPVGPTNKPATALDLTRRARAFVSKLKIEDSAGLAEVTDEQMRGESGYFDRELWNEICRVLEGLGYDTSKRREQYRWY